MEKTLYDLDIKIEILQNQNKILEQTAQVIFKSWFVDFDGVTEFEDSELGKIPKGWKVEHLSSLCTIKGRIGWRGYTRNDLRESGPLVIGGKHVSKQNRLDLTNSVHISDEKFDESPEIQISYHDIIIAKTGNVGPLALVDRDLGKATINPNVSLVKES